MSTNDYLAEISAWKARALAAEKDLAISKKLHAQKCDQHMHLETVLESIKRNFGGRTTEQADYVCPHYNVVDVFIGGTKVFEYGECKCKGKINDKPRHASEPAVYGGWYLCPDCRQPVAYEEQCKNCQKELDNRA